MKGDWERRSPFFFPFFLKKKKNPSFYRLHYFKKPNSTVRCVYARKVKVLCSTAVYIITAKPHTTRRIMLKQPEGITERLTSPIHLADCKLFSTLVEMHCRCQHCVMGHQRKQSFKTVLQQVFAVHQWLGPMFSLARRLYSFNS